MISDSDLCKVLAIIGIIYICKIAASVLWQAFQGFRAHIFSKIYPIDIAKKYGKWAVVTGCTKGIGRAYAFELARRGLDLVLISRNIDKLRELSSKIEKDCSVETKIIQADFSEGREIYTKLANELSSIDVGVLVNNVGVISEDLLYVSELKESYIWETININVGATTMMTRILLPSMILKRRGAIVNISSVSGIRPAPLLSLYSASKAFGRSLSTSMNEECRGSGVTVQTVHPGYINTDMLKLSKILRYGISAWIIPTPEQFAHHAVATIGIVDCTSGYWLHGFWLWMTLITMPEWLCMRTVHWIHRRLRHKERPNIPTSITGTVGAERNHIHL